MPPTTPGMTPEFASKWINDYGCNVYVHAADVNLFSTMLKTNLATIRSATNTEDCSEKHVAKKQKKECVI